METRKILYPVPLDGRKLPSHRIVRRLLNAKECRELVRFAETPGNYEYSNDGVAAHDVHICELPVDEAPWLYEKIGRAAVENNVWGFALAGFAEMMRIQKYEVEGHTEAHTDYCYELLDTSKITAVIPLLERRRWRGGRFTFGNNHRAPRLRRGDCLLFPGFVPHYVTPVTEGERVSLSAWVEGPIIR